MKKLLIIAAASLLFLGVVLTGQHFVQAASTTATSTSFSTVVSWGDSLTAGTGGTTNQGLTTSFPSDLSQMDGVEVINNGIPGITSTQCASYQTTAAWSWSYPSIFFCGYNDSTVSGADNSAVVEANIATMVANLAILGNTKYLVLSILKGGAETPGTQQQISTDLINANSASTYGAHYLDVQAYLLTQGNGSAQDNTDVGNNVVPTSLRYDAVHLNERGYRLMAGYISAYIKANPTLLYTPQSNASPLTLGSYKLLILSPPTFDKVDSNGGYYQSGNKVLTVEGITSTNLKVGLGVAPNLSTTTTATNSVYVGNNASAAQVTGTNNTIGGFNAAAFTTSGSSNTIWGEAACKTNHTGSDNTCIGLQAGLQATTTTRVTFVGSGAGAGVANASLDRDVAVGYRAGFVMASTSQNTLIGYQSGSTITNGAGNTLLGSSLTAGNLTTGNNNIGIGSQIYFPSATANNQLNIANLIFGTNPATTTAFKLPLTGAIGIASSSPDALLSVHANNGMTSKNLFEVGSSTGSATTTLFLVDNTGNVSINRSAPVLTSTGVLYPFSVQSPSNINAAFINIGASGATGGANNSLISDDGAALASGDRLGALTFTGSVDASHTIYGAANITAFAEQNFSGSQNGTNLRFSTTDLGASNTLTERMRLSAAGNLGIGTTSPGTLLSVGNTTGINFTTATTTFSSTGGINLTSGCFAIGGVCISGGAGSGTVGSGTTGQFPYYAGVGTTLTATSSLFLATSGNIGIGTTSPFQKLSVDGNVWASSTQAHFGTAACNNPLSATNAQGLEVCGSDNTLNGVELGVVNNNPGTSAFSFLYLNNNLADNTVTHYAGIGLNSSNYSDTSFGTVFAMPNQFQIYNTDGPTVIGASTTTSPGFVSFFTGGVAAANERMRITNGGGIGMGTIAPSSQLSIQGTTTDSTASALSVYSSTPTKIFQLDNASNLDVGTSTNGFHLVNNALTAGNGITMTDTKSGSGVTLQVLSATTNEALTVASKGTGNLTNSCGSGCNWSVNIGGSVITAAAGFVNFASSFRNATANPQFDFTGMGTSLTANTEASDFRINLANATFTHANSNSGITLQRDVQIPAGTHTFAGFNAGRNVFVDLATVGIGGAPIMPTTGNGTTTNASTLLLQSSTLNASTTNSFGIKVLANTGATNNYAGSSTGQWIMSGLTSSTAGNAVCQLASGELVNAGNTTCITSSKFTKEDIGTIPTEEALKVLDLRPVFFTNIEGKDRRYGFIAEEAYKIDPKLVELAQDDITLDGHTFKKGEPLAFDYERYTGLLTAMVQYQQKEIEALGGGKLVRSVEENWQWGAIGFLLLCFLWQQLQIRKLQKYATK